MNICVWGTGRWCELLLKIVPSCCTITAFVETMPKDQQYNGIKIVSASEYIKIKDNVDLTIVAVHDYSEIRDYLVENKSSSKVFFMTSIDDENAKFTEAGMQRMIDLSTLLSEDFIHMLDIMEIQKGYTLKKKVEYDWSKVGNLISLPFYVLNYSRQEEFLDNNYLFSRTNPDINVFDTVRLLALWMNLEETLKCVSGDIAELGVFEGATASILAKYGKKYNREIFLFDTFTGFDNKDLIGIDKDQKKQFEVSSLDDVKKTIGFTDICRYKKGYFPDTLDDECDRQFAFVHIDCDLYNPIKAGLRYFSSHLSDKGKIFVHDYKTGFFDGATRAVDEFCAEYGWEKILVPDMSGTVILVK